MPAEADAESELDTLAETLDEILADGEEERLADGVPAEALADGELDTEAETLAEAELDADENAAGVYLICRIGPVIAAL